MNWSPFKQIIMKLQEQVRELLAEVLFEESGKPAHPAKTLWHPGLQI